MKKIFRKKKRFETFTFDELVQYGKEHSNNVDPDSGMPWSFNIMGFSVTQESDTCYLVFIDEPVKFTTDAVLVFGVQDTPYIINSNNANIGQFL